MFARWSKELAMTERDGVNLTEDTSIPWRVGFEIELLAPPGSSRRDLAEVIAVRAGGQVQRIFYPQSELSAVPGIPVFENLTLGFDALDADGALAARCTDDLTIMVDLDREKKPKSGWYRIVSDDGRFLRLIMRQCNPNDIKAEVLQPLAELFGTELKPDGSPDGGMVKLLDMMGSSIAVAANLPGERERPCELITPPLDDRQGEVLADLLKAAQDLRFTVPTEAAVHIHFDAARLRNAAALARLVRLLHREAETLKALVETNPNCSRLGPFPDEVIAIVSAPGFAALDWPRAQARLAELDITKYCDFNLLNMVRDIPDKPTFEVRIFPGTMEPEAILRWARLFVAILDWAVSEEGDLPRSDDFYAQLALSAGDRAWLESKTHIFDTVNKLQTFTDSA